MRSPAGQNSGNELGPTFAPEAFTLRFAGP